MRVDTFLWYVRIFKSRNISTEYCKKNRVWLKDLAVKPSREITIGDTLVIKKNHINFIFIILAIPKSRIGARLVSIYIKNLTPVAEIEKMKEIVISRNYYRQKGLGRPTKKDRRGIDEFFDEDISFENEE